MTGHDEPSGDDTPAGPPPGGFLAQLINGGGDGDDFDDDGKPTDPPIHWPSLTADEAGAEWRSLYEWVATLQHRFRGMVRLPPCWYRHNDLVEALSALRDHERISYADTAGPTAAVAWHVAFRDIEARLRIWIAELRCGGDLDYHDHSIHAAIPPDLTPPPDLAAWIDEDQRARELAAVRQAELAAAG